MPFTLRKGTPGDGRACARIIREWGEETPWAPPLDDLDPMAAYWSEMIAAHPTWVAETGGEVVGFCMREDDIGNIAGLYVARAARGQGVGKHLLDSAKSGRDRLVVWAYEANEDARRFYLREGLVEVGRELEERSGLIDIEHHWIRPA